MPTVVKTCFLGLHADSEDLSDMPEVKTATSEAFMQTVRTYLLLFYADGEGWHTPSSFRHRRWATNLHAARLANSFMQQIKTQSSFRH